MRKKSVFPSKEFKKKIAFCDKKYEKLQLLRLSGQIPEAFFDRLNGFSVEHSYVLSLLFFLNQSHVLHGWESAADEELKHLAEELLQIENVFAQEGGLIGYQGVVEELLNAPSEKAGHLQSPPSIPLFKETAEVRKYIYEALSHLDTVAELYPVGGAADRLKLADPRTEERLPAAKLEFLSKTLLEGMLDDVFAREYLAYKLFGVHIRTPIGLMTSQELGNHSHIHDLCEKSQWFRRGKENFCIFSQPLVPCVSSEGKWIVQSPFQLHLKPGGHGMIWLLAKEKKVFDFFQQFERTHILLRQINNPIAGIDSTMLAFMGYGLVHKKGFGFASCPRKQGAKEGMNVLVQTKSASHITNVEYCDFERYGVEKNTGEYLDFPANTNILFAKQDQVEQALRTNPLPGKILNFSSKGNGMVSARLETMMQNVADAIPASSTYVTLSERKKTIASAKKAYVEGEGIFETPVGALYTYLENAKELLDSYCGFTTPNMPSPEEFEKNGPSFFFSYHPALGPLYHIISQKLRGGVFSKGASMKLSIADLYVEDLVLESGLDIVAENVMGHTTEEGMVFSEKTGKCILRHVKVTEPLSIRLLGSSVCCLENITVDMPFSITVPDGIVAKVVRVNNELVVRYLPHSICSSVEYTSDLTHSIAVSFDALFDEVNELE